MATFLLGVERGQWNTDLRDKFCWEHGAIAGDFNAANFAPCRLALRVAQHCTMPQWRWKAV